MAKLTKSVVGTILSCLLLLCIMPPRSPAADDHPDVMSLAGRWQVRLDAADAGLAGGWQNTPLLQGAKIVLPTTTDLAGLGAPLNTNTMRHPVDYPPTTRFPGVTDPARMDEQGYLVRRFWHVGPAWYERQIVIPEHWKGRSLELLLERVMWESQVWLNGRPVGTNDSLVAPQLFQLGELAPGKHRLTIRVDNRMIRNISTVTHAYGPETQSRWNGLVGGLVIRARSATHISSLSVHPAKDRDHALVLLEVRNTGDQPVHGKVRVTMQPEKGSSTLTEATLEASFPRGLSQHQVRLDLKQPAEPWDEFNPVRYRMLALVESGQQRQATSQTLFGFRTIERAGKQILLNGAPLFLRGTLDCGVYPKTGHPPMTVPEWKKVLGTVKEYGFNHVRYHTWCPPEAAFEAADQLGVYLQVETPAWVDDWGINTVTKPQGIGRDPAVFAYLQNEAERILAAYGNHPSFVLFALGNEFGDRNTDWDKVDDLTRHLKTQDPRRLYSGCTARRHLPSDDFWVTHNSGQSTRGIGPARTDWDFSKAAEASPVPVIAHETGQRPVFPDYEKLLPKFDGPLLPLNLERYRRMLMANGLDRQTRDFVQASARFQITQYKAEHEAMLRTRGYAGYQLLMLNDFTGQSEALVGILDPFWEAKGVVKPSAVREWNAPAVLLAKFSKYVWTSAETFSARVELANFNNKKLKAGDLAWSLENAAGRGIARGRVAVGPATQTTGLSDLGEIQIPLAAIREPTMLDLRLSCSGVENRWRIWVYPDATVEPEPAGVLMTRILDDSAMRRLGEGGKVLLLAHGLKNSRTSPGRFESVYWSAGWWGNRFSSLGILCDPAHPALAEFPTEKWSDWQWRDLCQGATTFDLKDFPRGFRPIVQPVPDFHYNALLGQVLEARVGKGSLVVCGCDLSSNLDQRPAARQFRRSLFRYVGSDAFGPTREVSPAVVEKMFAPAGLARSGAKILRVSSQDTANGNGAGNAIDGDPATIWHTRWQPVADAHPHELVIDLGKPRTISGIKCWPRMDQSNGRIARMEVFWATTDGNWGKPNATVTWADGDAPKEVRFAGPAEGRYLRIVTREEVKGQPFAALGELELIAE